MIDNKLEKEVREIANLVTKEINHDISDYAMQIIIDDIRKHEDQIEEGILRKEAKYYNIRESTTTLIREASIRTRIAGRRLISAEDINEAKKEVCPQYWPFC